MQNAAANAAAGFLTADEIKICAQTGTSLTAFALQKNRATGKALVMATHSRENSEVETNPSVVVKYAMDELSKFLKMPKQIDSLQFLGKAKAYLQQALRLAGGGAGPSAEWR